jgi:EGF-like domain
MKRGYIYLLSSLLFVIFTSVIGCNTNPCSDVVCKNNGTCREGACACPSGFEGNFCQNKAGDKFIGYWEGFKRINGGLDVKVTVIITPGNNPDEIIMYALSFSGEFIPIKAVCKLTDLNIPQQVADGTSGNSYSGTGYIEQDKYIHILYHELTSANITNTCIFEGTKKIIP